MSVEKKVEETTVEVVSEKPMEVVPLADAAVPEEEADKAFKPHVGKRPRNTMLLHAAIWLLLTAYIIALIIKGQGKVGYEFSIVVYVFISLRLLAQHVSISYFIYATRSTVSSALSPSLAVTPSPSFSSLILGAAFLVAIIVTAVASPATATGTIGQRLQSIAGLVCMVGILYATSTNRAKIPWHTVVSGLLIQFILALFIMRTTLGVNIFIFISNMITDFLKLSSSGMVFLFGPSILTVQNFAVGVLPAIVFFCSFVSIVYYLNGMQYVVAKMAWLMVRLMGTSGSESVVAAASPFVGQGESALLVRPFIEYMTTSELHSTMTSGFATIAGSVLLAYATATLLTACVMSIPCSLLISKMRYPETEESLTRGAVKIPENEEKDANFLHAAGNGAATGVQLILLIAVANFLCGFLFFMVGIVNNVDGGIRVSIGFILSYVFTPFAVAIGIAPNQARKAAEFLATKMVVNEFVAYSSLNGYAFLPASAPGAPLVPSGNFDARTIRLMAFALCGFANFASIGIQIGCLGAMAPSRKKDLATLALSAMLCGTVSTWMTAAVAGALI
ncbi:Na+ dependent nucleoside transporter C-terminus-domain-containing protein [Chytridium lagenaria]|nr:Na+ dependent nucleoside transporter C-terminus-domain-containing protein [Chytridium lagenaria]